MYVWKGLLRTFWENEHWPYVEFNVVSVVSSNSIKRFGAWVTYHHTGRTDVVQVAHHGTRKGSNGSIDRIRSDYIDRYDLEIDCELRCCRSLDALTAATSFCLLAQKPASYGLAVHSCIHSSFLSMDMKTFKSWTVGMCLIVFSSLSIRRKERIRKVQHIQVCLAAWHLMRYIRYCSMQRCEKKHKTTEDSYLMLFGCSLHSIPLLVTTPTIIL